MSDDLNKMALEYHRWPTPGKLRIEPTKKMANQLDLALAYSPGVAAACNLIAEDPTEAANMTARGNLVAVVSNGTAVLGLGNIGPLASKPVMEGKAVLFKKFAGIDVFDIEVDANDPERLIEVVRALEPTFGGINLEDIKAPECFIVEAACRETMGIPVFHDDQHGTAICVAAAAYNGLRLVGKKVEEIKIVCSGAGAAALACLDQLVSLGASLDNILVCDRNGIVTRDRDNLDQFKSRFARDVAPGGLEQAIEGADLFLGLSGPGTLKPEWAAKMAKDPLIMALANPTPEILPEEARKVRPDAIIATGRSDYPNQVNNVLCFPFIFRGALDVGATTINEEMKVACVKAIADLAMAEAHDIVAQAYGGEELSFGPEYILPKPFDPRLITTIAPAVAKAAMDSGVATRPIKDFKAYAAQLTEFVFRSGQLMRPIFDGARMDPMRLAYAEGEDERVLRAVQIVLDDGLAKPILVGRRKVIEARVKELGLRMAVGTDVQIIDPADNPNYEKYWQTYHERQCRNGVSEDMARLITRTRATAVAALAVELGDADAMLCGSFGPYDLHLDIVRNVVGLASGIQDCSALRLLIVPQGHVFIADTNVTYDPTAEEIAEMAVLASKEVQRFGMEPKVALVSHSNFGSYDTPSAGKMRAALQILKETAPELEVDGEMHADAALSEPIRERIFPGSTLQGRANLLIMPNLDSANIAFNLAKVMTDGLSIGPILIGLNNAVHIVSDTVTTRGLVNMSALAVVDAQSRASAG